MTIFTYRSIKKEAITTANTIEKVTDIDLNGNSIECAKLTITDTSVPFVLKNIMTSGKDYTFSLYLKNTNSSSITIMGEELTSSATWVRQYTSFTAAGTDLSILFKATGTYYFYNMQLETGKICSDWTPNPQDVDDNLENATSIAQQAADKFSWIVKSGTSSSNFEITDRLMNLVSANINLDGIVSFMNTAKGDGRKNLYNLDYSSFENVASQEDTICYAKDNGVTSVGIDSSVSYDGNKSLKISYTTANLNSSTTPLYLGSSANNYGCVKIQAGKQYILSCYVKSDSTTGMFMIDIQGHDTPDTKTNGLYLSNMDPRKLPGSSTYVDLSTDWQRAVCAIKVADNATGLYWSVVPLIWGKPSSSSAPKTFNVWVDCIMLEEVDSISNQPGTYILDKETIIDGGSIKTDTITGNQIMAGSITADKIATDAIKSHNYISSGGTQGSFLNLGDGSFTSPNLSWDSNGNLIATGGLIAGWTITNGKLYNGTSAGYAGIGKESVAWAFWAGASSPDDSANAPFRVGHDGSFKATDADITGIINATSGKIGRWNIDKDGLYDKFIVKFGEDQSDGTWLETFYTDYSAKKMFKKDDYVNVFIGNKLCHMNRYTDYQTLYDNTHQDYVTTVNSTIIQDGGIDLHTSTYSDSRFALEGIDYDNYGAHLRIQGNHIEFSLYNSDGTYSDKNTTDKLTFLSTYSVVTDTVECRQALINDQLAVTGDIHGNGSVFLTSGANKIQFNTANNGSIELYGNTPFIDFHYGYSGDDYTSRIIANGSNSLNITGNLWVDTDIHAGSFLYAREVHSAGAVIIASDSESYYWAHGFQIARGTSWGGVCIGDDSQGLRFYGSSIWAAHSISTSDENLKENFTTLDQYEDFYMNLNPIGFNYIGDYDGKKTHFGFGAHKTEDILESEGYDADKFAVVTHRPLVQEDIEKRFGKDVEVDIKTEYGVSYTEFIALNTHMIQKTRKELTKVKQEKADLEARLQAIEAKLGL